MKGNIITLTGEDIILDENNPTALVYAEGMGWVELALPDQQGYKRFGVRDDIP